MKRHHGMKKNSSGIRASCTEFRERDEKSSFYSVDTQIDTNKIHHLCHSFRRDWNVRFCSYEEPSFRHAWWPWWKPPYSCFSVDRVHVIDNKLAGVLVPPERMLQTCEQFYNILSNLRENHNRVKLDDSIIDHDSSLSHVTEHTLIFLPIITRYWLILASDSLQQFWECFEKITGTYTGNFGSDNKPNNTGIP